MTSRFTTDCGRIQTPSEGRVDLALQGGLILPDPENGEVFDHSVTLISNDSLISVNRPDSIIPPGTRRVDCDGCLIIPGLVNTHCHAAMSLLRGIGDDLPLGSWLKQIFPAEARFADPGLVEIGARLAFAESLLAGVTTVADGYYHQERSALAARDLGLRAVIGQGILDVPVPDCPLAGNWPQRISQFIEDFPHHPLVTPALFCHSLYLCEPNTLTKASRLAAEAGLLLFCHVSESAWEVQEILSRYGSRPVELLASLGVLGKGFVAVHGVHLNDREIDLLARAQTPVAHCPESNMKLASGAADVSRLLARGVIVGLGTDGPASNNNLDMIEEMRAAALMAKIVTMDACALDARMSLTMATIHGARLLGLGDLVGTLVPGKKADIAVVDMNKLHLTPLHNPLSHLVYSARGSDVRDVIVNGRLVVSHGRLQTVHMDDLRSQAVEASLVLAGRKGPHTR